MMLKSGDSYQWREGQWLGGDAEKLLDADNVSCVGLCTNWLDVFIFWKLYSKWVQFMHLFCVFKPIKVSN